MSLDRSKGLLRLFLMATITQLAISCVSRPGQTRTRPPRTNFYLYERFPDVNEFSERASGQPSEPIAYGSAAYENLALNFNTAGIVFDEHAGSRRMNRRCREALDELARLMKAIWPDVRLRIIAAWKPKNHEGSNCSLHYEGRAVDIITSDIDKSKLGLLARLAVEAGFDWVCYLKFRVHASVKSDGKGQSNFNGMGCYSTLPLEGGEQRGWKRYKAAATSGAGRLAYRKVVMFTDNKPKEKYVLCCLISCYIFNIIFVF